MSDLLIYHKQLEQIAHGRSFVMSNLSDSLTVAILTWATWAIRSQSLICPERSEQITHSRSFDLSDLSKWANGRWANERIPNPASGILILKFKIIIIIIIMLCLQP